MTHQNQHSTGKQAKDILTSEHTMSWLRLLLLSKRDRLPAWTDLWSGPAQLTWTTIEITAYSAAIELKIEEPNEQTVTILDNIDEEA